MADFDLAMALDADPSGLVRGAAQGEKAIEGLDQAARRSAAGFGEATSATERNTDATRRNGDATAAAVQKAQGLVVARANMSAATARQTAASAALQVAQDKLAAATDKDAAAQNRLAAAVAAAEARVAASAAGVVRAQAQVERATAGTSRTIDAGTAAANRAAFGARNLGQQFGDLATQVSLGGGVARAFASQAGQIGFALSEMQGRLGKVGAFLTGPWGIALTVGAVLLAPFAEKLFESGKAADTLSDALEKAAARSDSFGNAQSLIGKAIDLATGKLKTHNLELRETIRLQAEAGLLAAQAAERQAREAINQVGQPGFLDRVGTGFAGIGSTTAGSANINGAAAAQAAQFQRSAPLRALAREVLTGDLNATQIRERVDSLAKAGQLAGRTTEQIIELKNQLYDLPRALNDRAANQAAIDALDGKGVDRRLVPYSRAPKAPKPPSTAARDEFGRDAADRIANIVGQYDETPPILRQVNQQVRQLDDLIEDLGRRKPPNFRELIADAEKAKTVVREGVNRPLAEFITGQQESLQLLKLQAEGRTAEAEALRIILGMERQRGKLTDDQKAGVLASVEALRAQQRQIDINTANARRYSDALGGIKGEVEAATQAFVRGDLGRFIRSPGALLDAFQTLAGRNLFEKLFGDIFRDLQDQIDGTTPVEDASARMADAVDLVTRSTNDTTAALQELAASSRGAAGALSGTPAVPGGNGVAAPSSPAGAIGAAVAGAVGKAIGTGQAGAPGGNQVDPATGDIIVTGRRRPSITSNPTALFEQAIGKVGEKVASLFTDPTKAATIGKNIGQFAGKGLEGAATGTVVAGVGKALGIKLNSTGAQVGGAVGQIVGGPVGGIVGSIGGGLVGSLFGTKKDYGTSVVSGTGDNTGSGRGKRTGSAAAGLADQVQEGLQSIVDQLGGKLGGFNVSIGTYDGDFRVSTSGQSGELSYGKKNKSKSTLFDFGDDQAGAIAFAIMNAIEDGAVTGVSSAVQRALKSSTNLDRAVREAINVAELERAIGSVGDKLRRTFDDLSKQAAARVELARKYGLDLAAVEKLNAEERAKLIEDTLAQSVGALQSFLSDMTAGDLFEGSAADRRKALIDQIATTRQKAEAGEAGAADTLADLYRRLVGTSRDAYGTAGAEYGSDRQAALTGAQAVIKAEQDRVAQASGQQQAALAEAQRNNTLTDETNALLARTNAQLTSLPASLADALAPYVGGGGGGGGGLSSLARTVNLA